MLTKLVSLIPTVSFKSKLVLELTGYIPAPALKGLDNPWKGSVQKVEFKRTLTVVSSPCQIAMRTGHPEHGHEKATFFHPETAEDIMGDCQDHE